MEAPETQSPGISQMRKKPRMWSMRYAEKYLHDANPPSALSVLHLRQAMFIASQRCGRQ